MYGIGAVGAAALSGAIARSVLIDPASDIFKNAVSKKNHQRMCSFKIRWGVVTLGDAGDALTEDWSWLQLVPPSLCS